MNEYEAYFSSVADRLKLILDLVLHLPTKTAFFWGDDTVARLSDQDRETFKSYLSEAREHQEIVTECKKTIGKRLDYCWERAAILALWFFGQAERLLLRVNDASPQAKEREQLLWKVFRKIRSLDRGNGVSARDISISGIRNTSGKERRDAILELEDRGIIRKNEASKRYFIVKTPPEWKE